MTKKKLLTPLNIVIIVFILIALVLRGYEYFMTKPLWEDEAHLALNFIYFGYKDLMKPLANYQSAPIFFLFSIETISHILGFGEKALRLFPFTVSILTVPFFYFFVRDMTKEKTTAVISFILFGLNAALTKYSAELKPYTIDVSAYVILSYLLFATNSFVARNRQLLLAITGAAFVFFSNMTVVVFLLCGTYLILQWLKNRKVDRRDVFLLLTWATAFFINFFAFIFHHPYAEGMRSIWAASFCPTDIRSKAFSAFIDEKTRELLSSMLMIGEAHVYWYFFAGLLVVGIVSLVSSRKTSILLFTIAPIFVHLILSSLKLYPFYYRFYLYALPGLMILAATGINAIAVLLWRKIHPALGIAFVVGCLFFQLRPSIEQFPWYDKDIKPSLNYINIHYPQKHIYITTPLTLYQYYNRTGYVHNVNYTPIEWSLLPGKYYEITGKEPDSYILLCSSTDVDDYKPVIADLTARGLILHQFEYKTYQVLELRPFGNNTKN